VTSALDVFQRGVAALNDHQFEEAIGLFESLLPAAAGEPGLWHNLGIALRKSEKLESALACARRAVELEPASPTFKSALGNCLSALDHGPEAIAAQEAALNAAPGDFNIRLNYAFTLREFGRLDRALEEIQKCCEMQPDHVEAAWERGIILRSMGRFPEGWGDFDMRWKRRNKKEPVYGAPRWRGEDLSGKTILVSEEQGFGDTILCARYIPLLKARGARVLFGCRPALHRLFSGVQGLDRIVSAGPLGERFHYHSPIMSLPGIFGTTLDSVPPVPDLFAAPGPPPLAGAHLKSAASRLKVGIVWSGNPEFPENRKRAVTIERFLAIAGTPGIQLFSLQKGPGEDQLAASGAGAIIPALGPLMGDFADTAATLKQLDLVIMTDSSVAHLAGSLGVPVWNLLHYRPYWLYGMTGEETPWYRSMRLIRQPAPGDWDSAFAQVARELAAKCQR